MNSAFADISPTTLAEILGRSRVMDCGIRPLWGSPIPRLAGPAHTVRCAPGDNLMLHAAIYRAEPGAVIVVESGDLDYALAGGNVCAIAQRRGIAGFVLDGVIRDIAEIRELGFPVFARGLMPVPGGKKHAAPSNPPIDCGGVSVETGDVVVADEEGIVVVPAAEAETVLAEAGRKAAAEAKQTLDEWEADHQARVEAALRAAE